MRKESKMSIDKKIKVTKAKIEANRRNAELSTGPVTEEGKAIASQNAVKHGLQSTNLALIVVQAGESVEAFTELTESLMDCYQPVGALENMLVQRIILCFWRLRRVVNCETGSIKACRKRR